jgi:hypothetical protein
MANYYTHITFTVPLENEEQFMFLHDLVELATTLADWDEYKQSQVLAQSPEYQYFVDSPAGDIYVEKQKDADGASYAWLYCEEASDPWTFGLICQAFLSKFKPDGAIAFSWADTCDKPRTDTPQGGAIFVTATEMHVENTYDIRRRFMEKTGIKAINTSEGF